jgi:hypothetical protein
VSVGLGAAAPQTESPAPALRPGRLAEPSQQDHLVLGAVALVLTAGLVAYSQTRAWYGDEEFHLLAAQLINAGRRPYRDFVYPQPPLFAYWNALWMRLLGESWRVAHFWSALFSGFSVYLAGRFVYARLPENPWRLAASVSTALLIGLQFLVIRFGTIAQAYGTCLFLSVAAFCCAVEAVNRPEVRWPWGAGFAAGAAAACSLLAAPVAPVLGLWIALRSRAGERAGKSLVFLGGMVLPFLPLLALLIQAPRSTIFNVFEYHLFYRGANWRTYASWDASVLTSWTDSLPGMLLALLAAAGLLYLWGVAGGRVQRRPEFGLAAGLAAALGLHLGNAHPTYQQYFVLAIPFLAMLAGVGVFALGTEVLRLGRPAGFVVLLTMLLLVGVARAVYTAREMLRFTWRNYAAVVRTVDEITPREAALWADEGVYFAARRRPPAGFEHANSHKLSLPEAEAAALHVAPRAQVDDWVRQGRFHTIASCWLNEDQQEVIRSAGFYPNHQKVAGCDVYWREGS